MTKTLYGYWNCNGEDHPIDLINQKYQNFGDLLN